MRNRIGGICGLASQSVAVIGGLMALALTPQFSWTENYLSLLGVEARSAPAFNYGLVVGGALGLVFAVALWRSPFSRRAVSKAGIVVLVVGLLGFAGIGAFPRTYSMPHNLASLAFYTFIPLALLFIGIGGLLDRPKVWGAISIVAAALVAGIQYLPWSWTGGAIQQLLTALPWSMWTVAYAVRLLRERPFDAGPKTPIK
jgi:hypothetical membrane protein